VPEVRSKRLQIVLTLAERNEQAAAQEVAESRALLETEQTQLRQLEEYTEHYLQAYSAHTRQVRAQDLITYSGFIQRLSKVRAEQQHKLERITRLYEEKLQQWREKYQRRQSIADLITRLQQEENAVLEKKLQKELDDLTTQKFRSSSPDIS
jgi:flagellar FliJ protein